MSMNFYFNVITQHASKFQKPAFLLVLVAGPRERPQGLAKDKKTSSWPAADCLEHLIHGITTVFTS